MQVYRLLITSVLSISYRRISLALSIGTLLLLWWLVTLVLWSWAMSCRWEPK